MMLKKLIALIFIFTLAACSGELPFSRSDNVSGGDDTLFQTSTITALSAGDYDGELTVAQLKEQGDFGLGTYDALDGEMIVLDGVGGGDHLPAALGALDAASPALTAATVASAPDDAL